MPPPSVINPVSPVIASHPLNIGRTAWWMVLPGITSQTVLTDLMGRYPGTLVGFTNPPFSPSAQRPGGLGQFNIDNALTNYADMGTQAGLQLTGSLTFSGWVRPYSSGTKGFYCNASGTGAQNFDIYVNGSTITIRWGGGTVISNSITVPANVWTHIAFKRSGSAGSWDWVLYVNGWSRASGNTATDPTGGSYVTRIGREPTTNIFNGALDDISIWNNRVLSDAEILQVYNLAQSGYPGLLNRVIARPKWLPAGLAPALPNAAAILSQRVPSTATAPTLGSRIDYGSALARNLSTLYAFNEGSGGMVNDLAGGVKGQLLSDYIWRSGPQRSTLTLGAGTALGRTNLGHPTLPGDFTIACAVVPLRQPNSTDISAIGAWNTGASAGTNEYMLSLTSNNTDRGVRFLIEQGSTIYTATDATQYTLAMPLLLVGVKSGTTMTLYRMDGSVWKGAVATQACGAGAVNFVAGRTLKLGEIDVNGSFNTNARYNFVGIWNTALSPTDVERLSRNLYSMLSSMRQMRILIGTAGGGGAALTKSLAETILFSDSRGMGLQRVLSDGLTLSDGRAAGMGKTLSEGMIVSDVLSASLSGVLIKALSETLHLSDSRSASVLKTLVESLALSDLRSLSFQKALSEALTLQDLINAVLLGVLNLIPLQMVDRGTGRGDSVTSSGSGDSVESDGGVS